MNTIAQARIAVVGAGNTGASFAYTLLLSGAHGQILVVDPEIHQAEEQALELQQAAVFFRPHEVRAASIAELSQASIAVFCGVRRRPGAVPISRCGGARGHSCDKHLSVLKHLHGVVRRGYEHVCPVRARRQT